MSDFVDYDDHDGTWLDEELLVRMADVPGALEEAKLLRGFRGVAQPGGTIEYATDIGRERLLDTQRYRRERASFLQRRFPDGRIDSALPLAA